MMLIIFFVKQKTAYERRRIFVGKQKTAYEMLRSLVGSEMCIRDRPRSATGPNLAPGAQLRRRPGTRSGRLPGPPGRRRTLIGRPGDAEVPGARCGPSGRAHGLDPAGRNDGVDGATGRPAPAELRQGQPSDDLATGC